VVVVVTVGARGGGGDCSTVVQLASMNKELRARMEVRFFFMAFISWVCVFFVNCRCDVVSVIER
jgi:signal transduction histidine kinase